MKRIIKQIFLSNSISSSTIFFFFCIIINFIFIVFIYFTTPIPKYYFFSRNFFFMKFSNTCRPTCGERRGDWANWPTADWDWWLLGVAKSWWWPIDGLLTSEWEIWRRLDCGLATCNALALFPRCPTGSPRRPVYIGLCINNGMDREISVLKLRKQNHLYTIRSIIFFSL